MRPRSSIKDANEETKKKGNSAESLEDTGETMEDKLLGGGILKKEEPGEGRFSL